MNVEILSTKITIELTPYERLSFVEAVHEAMGLNRNWSADPTSMINLANLLKQHT